MHAQHTFETFLAGPSNAQALAHVRAVAEAPARGNPQPLYLYGPVSTGKSHLLEAIQIRLRETSPETKVLRVLFDIFLAELIWSFTKGDNAGFLEKYTAPDVLMIDDLHFIRGKEASQRYLLEIIRTHLEKGHWVILTSTCPLKDLDTLNDPPVCLEVPLELPDEALRLAAAKAKDAEWEINAGDEIHSFLAANCQNIRQIEGGLRRISLYRELYKDTQTPRLLQLLQEEFLPAIRKSTP